MDGNSTSYTSPLRCASPYRKEGEKVRDEVDYARWEKEKPFLHLISFGARWYAHLASFPLRGSFLDNHPLISTGMFMVYCAQGLYV